MLLTHRRISLIYLCLAGAEAAWITPIWVLMYRADTPVLLAYAGILATLLTWTLALEGLERIGLESPGLDVAALGLMFATSLGIVVIAVVGQRLPLAQAVASVVDFSGGFPPTLAFVVGNLILWQRATAATSRDVSFFGVGVSFRLGLLLLIAGAGLLSGLLARDFTPLLWVYLSLGLIAAAVARIHEGASDAQSAGVPLPIPRLAQLLAATGLTVGVAGALSLMGSPAGVRRFLEWLGPLWRAVEMALWGVLWLIGLALNPLLEWLTRELALRLRNVGLDPALLGSLQLPAEEGESVFTRLPPWAKTLLANAGTVLAVVVGALIVIGLLLLYLEKAQRERVRDEEEEAGSEDVTLGGGLLRRGLRVLRGAMRLMRRYGLGSNLLAAVSVQNIYANLCRLARRRGHGRRPAQPPDLYLPSLALAFPGQEEALARITAAYMRVHYGEHPITHAELAALRADYQAVRASEATAHPPLAPPGPSPRNAASPR